MAKITRRQLAKYAAQQLSDGEPKERLVLVLAGFLVAEKRAKEVHLLVKDIQLALQDKGAANVDIISAYELNDEVNKLLEDKFKHETGTNQVYLHSRIDKSVVGGLIARTPELMLDTTIKSKLRHLTSQREI